MKFLLFLLFLVFDILTSGAVNSACDSSNDTVSGQLMNSRKGCAHKCLQQVSSSRDDLDKCRSVCLLMAYLGINHSSASLPSVLENSNDIQQTIMSTFSEIKDIRVGKDCLSLYQSGKRDDGIYLIRPKSEHLAVVYCDMTNQGGGWTIIQRRVDDSTDFYRGWEDYKNGFGDARNNFWIGLDTLHQLTQGDTELYIFLKADNSNHAYAAYDSFSVGAEEDNYRLHVSGYTGNAGEAMDYHNGRVFSTKDWGVDGTTCATAHKGAWWYGQCHHSNLNGLYLNGTHTEYAAGINWYPYKGHYYSLTYVEMKIKQKET